MEYFVGIDFGHGDTAAWAVSMDNKDTEGKCLIMKPIEDIDKAEETKRPTVVYVDGENYKLAGGESSLLIPYIKGKYSVNDIQSDKKAKAFSEYIRLVVQELLVKNEQLREEETSFKLFIASPLRWNSDDRRKYKEFVNHSLHDIGIRVEWIIGESDAAYFTHCNRENESCILVIDFGSSTIDYTLMIDGKKVSDDSWSNDQLGASNIEENMFQHFIHDEKIGADIKNIRSELMKAKERKLAENIPNRLKFNCREGKEHSFTDGTYDANNGKMKSIVFCDSIPLTGYLKEMMGDYPEQVRNQFNELRTRVSDKLKEEEKRLKKQIKLDLVILSGGAFTMSWLVDMAKDVFKNSKVKKDPYPSYVVAKGIALYARKQYQALQDLWEGLGVIPQLNNAFQNLQNPLFNLAESGVISYEQIFKDADKNARNIIRLDKFKKRIPEIRDKPQELTGEYIRQQIIKIAKEFTKNTVEQEKEFDDNLNQQLKNSIIKILESTILNHFRKNLTDDDKKKIKIHIETTPYVLSENNFSEGGTYHIGGEQYIILDDLLNKALKRASGDICHIDMDKVRTPEHYRKIVDEFIPLYENHLSQMAYNYDNNEIKETVSKIKEQVKEQAEKLFYDLQLFETTYMG